MGEVIAFGRAPRATPSATVLATAAGKPRYGGLPAAGAPPVFPRF
jgi:hypothetical protein